MEHLRLPKTSSRSTSRRINNIPVEQLARPDFPSIPSNNRLSENLFDGITKPKPTQLISG